MNTISTSNYFGRLSSFAVAGALVVLPVLTSNIQAAPATPAGNAGVQNRNDNRRGHEVKDGGESDRSRHGGNGGPDRNRDNNRDNNRDGGGRDNDRNGGWRGGDRNHDWNNDRNNDRNGGWHDNDRDRDRNGGWRDNDRDRDRNGGWRDNDRDRDRNGGWRGNDRERDGDRNGGWRDNDRDRDGGWRDRDDDRNNGGSGRNLDFYATVESAGRDRLTVRADDGQQFTVTTRDSISSSINRGDRVRVTGESSGRNVITEARVTFVGNNGNGPFGQTVNFLGTVQDGSEGGRNITVRGDNGRSFTVRPNNTTTFRRGERVRIIGRVDGSAIEATSITRF